MRAAVLLCAAILAAALVSCSGSKSRAVATPVEHAQPTRAIATQTAEAPDLASQIGVRAALPKNDPIDLALRYRRTSERAATSKPFAGEAQVGDVRQFTVMQLTAAAIAQETPPLVGRITATLEARSAHAYFYADDAIGVRRADMQAAADQFEATVWPKVTAAFGEPAIPGIDGDPRIVVLQSDLGGAGGYFSVDDVYLKAVDPLSNEAEMVYMSETLKAGTAGFNVVLAHEFQHLVHAKNDRYEETWVNEGLSEDASMLVGGAVSSINAFEAKPQTQLNAWDSTGSSPHYGASAAFFRYLASRFGGDDAFGAIAREPGDGQAGVDEFLHSTGSPLGFRDVFADWIAANVLDDPSGAYANPQRPLDVAVNETLAVGSPAGGTASQFGADYYRLALGGGDYVLKFSGAPEVAVLPTHAPDAGPMIWGNAQDSIDTRLTREVDLSRATDPALTFKTWYDIERWFDWGYVSVSADEGATWTAVAGDHTTSDNPVQAAYGPGYTGKSGGGAAPAWVDERVSLAAYAGKRILLRFEYVTDASTHGEGWAIDDLAITGAAGAGGVSQGWRSEGWVRLDQSALPQTYAIRVIEKLSGGGSKMIDVPLDASGAGELRLGSAGVQQATLAIAGTTEGTDQRAPYRVELDRP
jgi:hypothetical protein